MWVKYKLDWAKGKKIGPQDIARMKFYCRTKGIEKCSSQTRNLFKDKPLTSDTAI